MSLTLCLLLAPLAGWGQSGWHYTAGGDLRAVKFIGNEGWAVGAQGLIIHTTDGGANWEVQKADTVTMDLSGVSFVDNQYGWAVGNQGVIADGGVILKTRNGGQTWQVLPPPRRWHYYQICFVDTLHGMATTQRDTIIRTTDGGNSWELYRISPINTYFRGIDCLDSLRGYVAGEWGVYYTSDGGRNWLNTSPIGFGVVDVDFADTLHGWAIATGLVAYTSNGGNTWNTQNTGVNAGYESVSFPDTMRGWIVGGNNGFNGVIGQTTNKGQTWNVIQGLTNNNTFHSVHAPEITISRVVGTGGTFARTTNGGGEWRVLHNVDISNRSLLNTSFHDSNQGWAVGTYGVITHTTNGGTVWNRQTSGTSSFLYGVDFPDPNAGWVCTEGGGILKTTNAGNVWFGQSSGTTYPLFSIDFPDSDARVGVAVGGYYGPFDNDISDFGFRISNLTANDKMASSRYGSPRNDTPWIQDTIQPWGTGQDFWKWPWRPEETVLQTDYRTIIRTTNGGALWIAQNTSGQVPLYGVSLVTPREGWACGDPQGGMGVILHTTDSGATWQGQTSNVNRGLYWIQFRTSQNGWCVGDYGTALWTTDGGTTWNQGNTGTTSVLWSCAFYDNLNGFACGNNGLLIKTEDGGRNWTLDTSKVYANLTALNVLDTLHVWTVGSYGMVLGWREAGVSGVEQGSKGAGELRVRNGIKAWPNPFVSFARVPGHEKERFALYDIMGRRVGTYKGDKIGADATAGVYFLMAEGREAGPRSEGRPVRIVKVR
jgi:photosystem II stability/assembly factor-like uncharacterized protein